MAQVNLSDYKTLYIQTAKECVDSLSAGCDKLVSDSQDKNAVNQIHISSHSLKSQSQVMGFRNMANLCAIIEKISAAILEGSFMPTSTFTSALKDSINELSLCLTQIEKENKEKDLSFIVKRLEKYVK